MTTTLSDAIGTHTGGVDRWLAIEELANTAGPDFTAWLHTPAAKSLNAWAEGAVERGEFTTAALIGALKRLAPPSVLAAIMAHREAQEIADYAARYDIPADSAAFWWNFEHQVGQRFFAALNDAFATRLSPTQLEDFDPEMSAEHRAIFAEVVATIPGDLWAAAKTRMREWDAHRAACREAARHTSRPMPAVWDLSRYRTRHTVTSDG